MSTALPFRFSDRNTAVATAAPAAYILLATRPLGADNCETILRGEFEADDMAAVRRHARQVADALDRRGVEAYDVEVLDAGNLPVFIIRGGEL